MLHILTIVTIIEALCISLNAIKNHMDGNLYCIQLIGDFLIIVALPVIENCYEQQNIAPNNRKLLLTTENSSQQQKICEIVLEILNRILDALHMGKKYGIE